LAKYESKEYSIMRIQKICQIISLLVIISNSCDVDTNKIDTRGATVLSVNIDSNIKTETDFINAIDSLN
jgi:hypothetical protein